MRGSESGSGRQIIAVDFEVALCEPEIYYANKNMISITL